MSEEEGKAALLGQKRELDNSILLGTFMMEAGTSQAFLLFCLSFYFLA